MHAACGLPRSKESRNNFSEHTDNLCLVINAKSTVCANHAGGSWHDEIRPMIKRYRFAVS